MSSDKGDKKFSYKGYPGIAMEKSEAPAEELRTATEVGRQMLSCEKVNSGTGRSRTTKGTLAVVWLHP